MVVEPNIPNNSLTYHTRYTHIDKYEILDHENRLLNSGTTNIFGWTNGLITHSGLSYTFPENNLFTYKSYFLYRGEYYLAAHLLLQSFSGETSMLDAPFKKVSRTYRNKDRRI